MKKYIQYEMCSFFSKRNCIPIFLCMFLILTGFFYDSNQYKQSYYSASESLKEASRYEQSHIDILNYDIQNGNENEESELNFWLKELEYTNQLIYEYQIQNDENILKYRLLRNKNLMYGIKKNYVNERLDSKVLLETKINLKKQIKTDAKNLELNLMDGVIESKPTFFYYLKGVQNGNYGIWILFLMIALLNGNVWSKEFSGYGGYEIVFSYPLKKSEILFVRNIVHGFFSVVCLIFVYGTVCIAGLIFYGSGFEQFVLYNNETMCALESILRTLPLFFVSLITFIHLIQFLSFFTKEEMSTYFIFTLIVLISMFWLSNFNMYSYESNNITLKLIICMLLNFVFMLTEFIFVEKKDLTR